MYLTMTFQSLGLCEGDEKNSRRPPQQEQQSGRIVSNRIWYQAPMRQERTGAIHSTPRAWSRQNPEGVWQNSIQTEISADSNLSSTTAISSNRIWYHVPLHQDRTGSDNRIPRTWSRQNPDGVWQTPRQLRVSNVYPAAIGNQPLDNGSGIVDPAPPYPESPSAIEQPPTYQAATAHVTPETDLP